MTPFAFFLWLGTALAGDDPLDEPRTRLRDSNKWVRAEAVEKLAAAGMAEAWEEVLGALADRAGEVADTAQWELGRAGAPEVVEGLLGKRGLACGEPLVRERAAEALGRCAAPVAARDVARALDDREPRVRRALAAGCRGRAAAQGFAGEPEELSEALARAARKDRDGRAAGHALLALAELDAARARAVWAELRAGRPAPELRCAAARAAPGLGLGAQELALLGRAEERAVRAEAAAALARAGTRDAAQALAELLGAETEERLARRLTEDLRALSGLKHGRDPRPWRDWSAGLPPGWRPPAAPAPAAAEEGVERSVALAGVPILSGRVAFLIDLSGSMWFEREEGKTRKQVVDGELRACIERLPEATRFNLIPYTAVPLPWKPGLVEASPRNRAAAAAWFEGLHDRGSGNFFDAFLLALADPEVDTVVMLGDGEPTGGARYRLELLPSLIDAENLGRSVTVDSILVGTRSGRTFAAWQEIARLTGGLCRRVEL